MFDISATLAAGTTLIQSYGPQGFTLAGVQYEGAIYIHEGIPHSIDLKQADECSEEAIASIIASLPHIPEILLLGTGKTHHFIAPSIRQSLKQKFSIALDSMDTGAACRTFNVLVAESRSVAAILLPVGA